ncbi:MAG: DUF4041 domain-containing protein [Phycisphaerales bacterium]
MIYVLFILLVVVVVVAAVVCGHFITTASREHDLRVATDERFAGVTDARKERDRILAEIQRAQADLEQQRRRVAAEVADAQAKVRDFSAQAERIASAVVLQEVGFYAWDQDLKTSEEYRYRLEGVREAQKALLASDQAISVNRQLRGEEKKQARAVLKLMLRAFNGESDAAIARVTYRNLETMAARIAKACEIINNFGDKHGCAISPQYLKLKLQELRLVHEREEKLQQEKEEQRRIREQMRDEEMARREMERAMEQAEREERQYALALAKAKAEAAATADAEQDKLESKIQELEARLAEAQANRERAISRAQMTKAGHVYIISNPGSFGEDVFKVGMTRRLDPMDRVWELGDASVPFDFDVHAIIFSEDAPSLEAELHRALDQHRVNRVNRRKEFFRVPVDAVAGVVRKHHAEIEFVRDAEAKEWRQSLQLVASNPGGQLCPP